MIEEHELTRIENNPTAWDVAPLLVYIRELQAEVERRDRERGQACYDRDAARSVVAHWEERALEAEAEVERLRDALEAIADGGVPNEDYEFWAKTKARKALTKEQ